MKRISTILLALMVTLSFTLVQEAQAGWWKKDKKKGESRQAKVQRLDRMPTMGFYRGILNVGTGGQWDLDGTPVTFSSKFRAFEDGALVDHLRGGTTVIMMGEKVGGVIMAWQVMVQKPEGTYLGLAQKNPNVIWSDSNPSVGEGRAGEY